MRVRIRKDASRSIYHSSVDGYLRPGDVIDVEPNDLTDSRFCRDEWPVFFRFVGDLGDDQKQFLKPHWFEPVEPDEIGIDGLYLICPICSEAGSITLDLNAPGRLNCRKCEDLAGLDPEQVADQYAGQAERWMRAAKIAERVRAIIAGDL